MVVHERGYQRWDGDRSVKVPGAAVILERGVSTALAGLFKRKFFAQILTFGAYGTFLFGLGVLYLHFFFATNPNPELARLALQMEESGMLANVTPNPDSLWGYLFVVQKGFVLVLCVLVGSGLIAEDRRSNALELYLSRPLNVRDYVLGKLGVVSLFLAMVTVVPAMLLIVVQMMLTGFDEQLVGGQLDLLWRTPLAGGVMVLVASLLVLAASSLAQRARNAAILFIGLLVLLEGVLRVMVMASFPGDAFKLITLDHNVGVLMAWILGNTAELDPATPVARAAVLVGAWCAVALTIVLRRVRPVEVVA